MLKQLTVDNRAIVHPSAKLGENVIIGPWSLIGPDVVIGAGTEIGSHTVIKGPTKIGQNNQIFSFCSIGEVAQDKKHQGGEAFLEIGDDNTFREFCTIHRGTDVCEGMTRIGSHNLFLNYCHIAHDCIVGNHVIFSNNATLAGHVIVQDHVNLGGFSAVHQFVTIGEYSFISAKTAAFQDVIPYIIVSGFRGKPSGINKVGLKRAGFSESTIRQLMNAYKVLFKQGKLLSQAIVELKSMLPDTPEIQPILDIVQSSNRGIARE